MAARLYRAHGNGKGAGLSTEGIISGVGQRLNAAKKAKIMGKIIKRSHKVMKKGPKKILRRFKKSLKPPKKDSVRVRIRIDVDWGKRGKGKLINQLVRKRKSIVEADKVYGLTKEILQKATVNKPNVI